MVVLAFVGLCVAFKIRNPMIQPHYLTARQEGCNCISRVQARPHSFVQLPKQAVRLLQPAGSPSPLNEAQKGLVVEDHGVDSPVRCKMSLHCSGDTQMCVCLPPPELFMPFSHSHLHVSIAES